VLPLEYSIYVGVVLSLTLYVYTSASSIHVVRLISLPDNRYQEVTLPETLPSREPVVISVTGHLYFAAVRNLERRLPGVDGAQQPVVILRLRDNPYIGSTGVVFLRRYAQKLRDRGGLLLLSGIGPEAERQLERTGFLDEIGAEKVFTANAILLDATDRARRYADEWLSARSAGKSR
jgi:SulP family sulfate permease